MHYEAQALTQRLHKQSLRHPVPDPKSVLLEFNRVLKNNGHLFVTTPFIHLVHEEPYDFFVVPLKVLAGLDKQLDTEQKYTLGYAFHAIKVEDV